MSEVKRYSAHWAEVWDETEQDWAEPRTDGVISYEFVLAADYDAKCAELEQMSAHDSQCIKDRFEFMVERDQLEAVLDQLRDIASDFDGSIPADHFERAMKRLSDQRGESL